MLIKLSPARLESFPGHHQRPKALFRKEVQQDHVVSGPRVLHSGATHMVLPMARPQLHPRSGVYWLRKRVPADLVAVIGRREVTLSLQTKNQAEARARYAQELARLEQRWASMRAGPRSLTEIEAHALAMEVHEVWLRQHRANPSEQAFWRVDLAPRLWVARPQ